MDANSNSSAGRFYAIASIFIVVAALSLASDLFVPLALAVFLSFLLAPLATRLERLGLGRIGGALASVAFAFAVTIGLGFLITEQFISLARQLPEYEDNIRSKILYVQQTSASTMERVTRSVWGLRRELTTQAGSSGSSRATSAPTSGPAGLPEASASLQVSHLLHGPAAQQVGLNSPSGPASISSQPAGVVPVEVIEPQRGLMDYMASSMPTILGPVGDAIIVVVLTVFMLIQRRDLRDRLIALAGRSQLYLTTQALDDMTRRISRYLVMQLLVNACYAVPLALGLALFGLPNALLWGLMGLALRFVPYVGAWTMAAISVLLAVAVYPGWWGAIGVLVFLTVLELFLNNVIEPWLYSVGSGVSMLGVIFSAVFWAWLWGPVGLLLATPIAVCLTVMGRYIPQLEFLDVILGGSPKLEPKFRFLQRLLAMDLDEAGELAAEVQLSKGLLGLYDELILPALERAEQERHRGQVEEQKQTQLYRAFRDVIEEAAERDAREHDAGDHEAGKHEAGSDAAVSATTPPVSTSASAPAPANESVARQRVLCLPAGDEADELAGLMLARLLERQGYDVETISVEYFSGEMLTEVENADASLVIISALPPGTLTAARYLCKRVVTRLPSTPTLIGLWNAVGNIDQAKDRLVSCGARRLVLTYRDALAETARLMQSHRLARENGRS